MINKFAAFEIKRYKYTLTFVVVALISPIILILVIGGIQLPLDFVLMGIINALLFLFLRKKIELQKRQKVVTLVLTMLISVLAPLFIFIAIFLSPAQKEADRILFDVCLPAVRKYYNVSTQENLPQIPKDKNNNPKWWYQAMECERNIWNKKEATFSANPVNFTPVKE